MAEPSEKSPSLFSAVFTHLFTAVLSGVVFGVGGFLSGIYLNTPQEGSPNLIMLRKLGLTEPPSLDCPGFQQEMFYEEARELLQKCGWFASTTNVMYIKHFETRRVASDTGWTEAQHCIGTGLANCRFIYHKGEKEFLVVFTSGMDHVVTNYSTSWEPISFP